MEERVDPRDEQRIVERIRTLVAREQVRVTQHAQQEMAEAGVTLDDVLGALAIAHLLENYPEHQRGACCLVLGWTPAGRPLHVVCTTNAPLLIIITVYEPQPPRWTTPTQRRIR